MEYTKSPERAQIDRMFDLAGDSRDYPGAYFCRLARAKSALAAWRTAHPDLAAAEDAAEIARRQADYDANFIGWGLD